MFLCIRRFIFYLLIYSLWPFFAQGTGKPILPSILKIDNQLHTKKQNSHLNYGKYLTDYQTLNYEMLEYFLDIIFENSFCRCQGNNGCTRGCRLAGLLNQDQYPPVRKCVGKKSIRNSFSNCARHITGAIMAVAHDFLVHHCESLYGGIIESVVGYQQCVDNFREDVKNKNTNICRNSFIFPSALCMLNLDGQSARVYNVIPHKSIRSKCKSWNRYNQSLLTVNNLLYGGIKIPLFKKISHRENRAFQKDPRKIPEGAIIITKSHLKHGHVEVKTNRDECGKNKNQICFCSDYCRERSKYDWPVLAVFEWNPEFMRYVDSHL